jgi:serine/threonine protein kinase
MLDGQGHIILIDYGLSKRDVDSPAGAQSLVGTPDYSAPEVLKTGVFRIENEERQKQGKKVKTPSKAKGEVGYGKAADWWSLGVMIFEMLAGLPAFRGVDLRQTYQKVLYADVKFEPESNFSPAARDLILGLLQR